MDWTTLLIDFVFFSILMGAGWTIGYFTGRTNERESQQMAADLNRIKLAQAQQLYDWKRDGV